MSNFGSEILFDTREVKDEISLTWRIENFSKIHKKHKLEAHFTLPKNMTSWILKLYETYIELNRIDNGEHVYCDIEASLVTLSKAYVEQVSHEFDETDNSFDLIVFDQNYEYDELDLSALRFQDDIFKLHFNMKVSGPAINRIIRSEDFLKPHCETLIDDFRNLLNSKQHCDVTISTGSKKLPVHKAVLCARSKVFNRKFQYDAEKNKNEVIELDDFDFNIVKDFVTFLYTGNIEELSTEKAKNLYHIAGKYDVTDLRIKCAFYLEFNLCIDEACSILKLAEMHKDIKLKYAVIGFILNHASAVKETDGWNDLVKEQPELASEVLI